MNSLCCHVIVAQELIQKDDLIWLFVGASTFCSASHTIWRDANSAFLFSIVEKALSPPVIKYIHCIILIFFVHILYAYCF